MLFSVTRFQNLADTLTQAQMMKGKPKPKEKMPWTCCEIRKACKERDMGILTQISNFLKCGVQDDYPIFKVWVYESL